MADPEGTVFGGALQFFDRLGVYDVLLPFLLVFTILFAILEKTRIFGTDIMRDGTEITKKNLNAMTAFVIAFLVIASSQLVRTINVAMANMVVLILLGVSFLMLIGVFYSSKEEVVLTGKWRTFFMVLMFIGIVLIFLHAIPGPGGEPFLFFFLNYIFYNFNTTAVSSLIMLLIIVLLMFFITKTPKEKSHGDSGSH